MRNVRADPAVTLRHGPTKRRARLEEVRDGSGAPVVSAYYRRESFSRRYIDVPESPTLEDFVSRAAMFPVFRVDPIP